MVAENYFAFADDNGKLKIFDRSNFSLLQEITISSNIITSISADENSSVLITGALDQYVKIYRRNGRIFAEEETINMNFGVGFLKISSTRVLVAGYEGKIVILERKN